MVLLGIWTGVEGVEGRDDAMVGGDAGGLGGQTPAESRQSLRLPIIIGVMNPSESPMLTDSADWTGAMVTVWSGFRCSYFGAVAVCLLMVLTGLVVTMSMGRVEDGLG